MNPLAAFLAAPKWLRDGLTYAAIIAVAIALLLFAKWKYDRDLIAEYERGQQAAIAEIRAKADARAREAATGHIEQVERENDEARKAASGSDDPLKAGLDALP